MRALVLPMRYANGRTRRDETLTSFLARISGQKNAISNGCKAGPGSHELYKAAPLLASVLHHAGGRFDIDVLSA